MERHDKSFDPNGFSKFKGGICGEFDILDGSDDAACVFWGRVVKGVFFFLFFFMAVVKCGTGRGSRGCRFVSCFCSAGIVLSLWLGWTGLCGTVFES